MTVMPSPLIHLHAERRHQHSTREHRRTSSEFGWFDVESLLSSRTPSSQSGFWGSEDGEDSMQESTESYAVPDSSSVLPRALERLFCWLQDVETLGDGAGGVDEAIIDAGALLHLRAPSSSARQESDKVVASCAVTKADFCVASRDQPSIAVGIYAYRVVCRSKWMLWSDSYPEFLVVTATGTELLRAWRTYSDFSSLARTATALRAGVAAEFWNRLEPVLGKQQGRRTDPSSLKTQSRLLSRFLTIMLEELASPDVDVLAEFVREPITYVIVGVEDIETEAHDDAPGSTLKASSGTDGAADEIVSRGGSGNSSCPPGGGAFGVESIHPMKWDMMDSPPKPAPRVREGL
ncbi:unnamed protein product [Scytosiphon promiscuus]